MASVYVERLDHLGLLASTIRDLGLIGMIDARLVPDEQEEITPGEAVAGMILNGLGVAKRPLSLTPQFCAHTPLDLLCRGGVHAEMFHRFQRGRTLAEVYADGGDVLLSALAVAVCAQAGIDLRFHHLDTTSFARSGADVPDSDEHAMTIPHGDSKAHRPDWKQAVLALRVSQAGGGPVGSKSWAGHASDTQMFQERAAALLAPWKRSPTPRSLGADAKLYHEANAANLRQLGCIPRLPNPLTLMAQVLGQALREDTGHRLDEPTRSQRLALCPYGMAPRGLVVSSQAALERAKASVNTAQPRDAEGLAKPLFPRQAHRFETPAAAHAAVGARATSWRYHQGAIWRLMAHQHYACKGRPTPTTPSKSMDWQRQAQGRPDHEKMARHIHHQGCLVVGTNSEVGHLSALEVMAAYTGQAQAEGGFRLLTAPRFFVSSLFVKTPGRMQGLLLVMTCALLVYAVAQRRLRQYLTRQNETIPNQSNQPTARPTLRWVFQLLEGMHRVRVTGQGKVHDLIEGLNEVQIKILRLFGEEVCRLYQISPG
jgi:transposase